MLFSILNSIVFVRTSRSKGVPVFINHYVYKIIYRYCWCHLSQISIFFFLSFSHLTFHILRAVPLHLWDFKQTNTATTNVLGIVMFSVVLGTALGKLGSAGKPLLNFFVATSEAMMIITHWVIWYANKTFYEEHQHLFLLFNKLILFNLQMKSLSLSLLNPIFFSSIGFLHLVYSFWLLPKSSKWIRWR